MKKQDSLPIYGVGPIYVCVCNSRLYSRSSIIANSAVSRIRKIGGSSRSVANPRHHSDSCGIALWIYAVPISKIDDGIKENRLVTTGAYALVRNPIYSAAMIACTGVILILSNAWFFVLPLVYWLFMTVLMKATEEKWLRDLYGKEYDDYCKRVNRCWPWIRK